MTEQIPNQTPEQTPNSPADLSSEPFIPPRLLLVLAAAGFIVALVVLFTQPTFNVVGYGALAFGVLALLAWVVIAPAEARNVLTGRTVRFGGTSLIVTAVFIAALVAVYTFVRDRDLRIDLTQRNDFSLTEESRTAISGLGADPNLPQVKIIAFYGAAQAGQRDRNSALFDDYAATSSGKISYEFIDPDRNPAQAQLYGITRAGQIAVVAIGEDGQPDAENAEILNSALQDQLTNAILKVAAQGDFVAYFLTVRDNVSSQMTALKDALTNRFDWTVEDVSLPELTGPQAERRLNDPNLDGEVVVIPGGSRALADAELEILQQYVDAGGDLVVFAGTNLNTDQTSLATSDNFNAFLERNFGLRINNDIVLDQTQAFQSALIPVATDLDQTAFVTSNGVPRGQGAMVFEAPHSIEVLETAPQNVVVTQLVRSSPQSYQVTDLQRFFSDDPTALNPQEGDPQGPFVLAAQAENTQTGARLVVFGSTSPGSDAFTLFSNIDNLSVAFNSLVWTTDFNNFVQQITVTQQQRPQDAPIFVDAQQSRTINFVTIILLPFGVLFTGVYVWWRNRERGAAAA